MDTFKKELVDTDRVDELFVRVRTKLQTERLKTNEKYLELLIGEINSYFTDVDLVRTDARDLADKRSGPAVKKHNNLLLNTINNIDKIHRKKLDTEDVITKCVNYLSNERVGLSDAVSKLYTRILNHKIRSSANNRHVTVFTEYFTDDSGIDKIESKKVSVDSSVSALTLSAVIDKADNSNLIDPESIFLRLEIANSLDENNKAVFPLCNQPKLNKGYFASFGRSLSKDTLDVKEVNLMSAGDDPLQVRPIQRQALVIGNAKNVVDDMDENTVAEFEVILNDMNDKNLVESIQSAVQKSKLTENMIFWNPKHIITDTASGLSFRHARKVPVSDKNTLAALIQKVGLTFKFKQGINIPGFLSYIWLAFAPAKINVSVPRINVVGCYIKDASGTKHFPFRNPNSKQNAVIENQTLLLNSRVVAPMEFYIDFDMSSIPAVDISEYLGLCWKVIFQGNQIVAKYGDVSTTYETRGSSNKLFIVYQDLYRVNPVDPEVRKKNLPVVREILALGDSVFLTD